MLVLLCKAQEIVSIGAVKNIGFHLKSKMQSRFLCTDAQKCI